MDKHEHSLPHRYDAIYTQRCQEKLKAQVDQLAETAQVMFPAR